MNHQANGNVPIYVMPNDVRASTTVCVRKEIFMVLFDILHFSHIYFHREISIIKQRPE